MPHPSMALPCAIGIIPHEILLDINITKDALSSSICAQQGFEQPRSTLHGFFSSKYIGNYFGDLQQFEKKPAEETCSLEIQKKFEKKVCHECIKYRSLLASSNIYYHKIYTDLL